MSRWRLQCCLCARFITREQFEDGRFGVQSDLVHGWRPVCHRHNPRLVGSMLPHELGRIGLQFLEFDGEWYVSPR